MIEYKKLLRETEPLNFNLHSVHGNKRKFLAKKLYGSTFEEREYAKKKKSIMKS